MLKQEESIPDKAEIELLEKKAKLLQSYGYLVKDGDFELRLSPDYTGENEEILIELDPDKSLASI